MNTMQAVAVLDLPPITPTAVVLFIVFGIPLIALSGLFVHMCGVLKRQDEAKENGNA